MNMEILFNMPMNIPPFREQTANTITDNKLKVKMDELIDDRVKTAMATSKPNNLEDGGSWLTSILVSKAVQDIGNVFDARQHGSWNQEMKMLPKKQDHNPEQH